MIVHIESFAIQLKVSSHHPSLQGYRWFFALRDGHPPLLEIGAPPTTCDYAGEYGIESYVDSLIDSR
jgi:hypothetical protein